VTISSSVPDDVLSGLLDVHMVETIKQLSHGVCSGAFKENECICIGAETYRICAPTGPAAGNMKSCIMWTKESSMDISLTWDKVVSALSLLDIMMLRTSQFGGAVYNISSLDSNFGADDEVVKYDMKSTMAAVEYVLLLVFFDL
jgi:hypothetical protein